MITFEYIAPQDFIKPYSLTHPTKEVLENFSQKIKEFLHEVKQQNDEEYQKNEINELLTKVYKYKCNTLGKIDSAIYADGEAQVLIETKALKNKTEFPKDTPLSKALCEAILYFLREIKSNNSIKHIILCNPHEFYIFDAQSFNIFSKDATIKKLYKNCDGKEGTDTSTKKFYESLEKYLKSEFEKELAYTHFSFKDELSIKELSTIYQLLSPQVLLKTRKTLDANTLNKNFYEELLYILGLEEKGENGKNKGKILIKPSPTPHTLSSEISRHYALDEESIFTLITTWNNRILFLRLLESMLLSFKHINKPFLDINVIKDFKALDTLFFEVLAKKNKERSYSLPKELLSIPYLNSSLFDRIALEQEGKTISGLDSYKIPFFSHSILKKNDRYKDSDGLSLLEYIFEFLHAYDFTTTPKDIEEGVKKNHDKLINSAVLGLVFEKLNGYKEGSFYTPSFITSYMCKESITQAVIDKFNSAYDWKCENVNKLKEKIAKEEQISDEEFLKTLLSLKICDPAVGSGHFLVSALNEIVLIAHTLRIFPLPRGVSLEVENDEILIKDREGILTYHKPTVQSEDGHIIQTKIFNLKKSIIENCLFGVDINPNSCEITKLRLWIELLKYSYYLFDEKGANTNALETLPNIDINIKCGNSLISYFKLNQSLTHYPNIAHKIQLYKQKVCDYKNGFFNDKSILNNEIKGLLSAFKNFCFKDKYKKEIKDFQARCDKYRLNYGDYLAKDDKELSVFISTNHFPVYDLSIGSDPSLLAKAQKEFDCLKELYNTLYNLESNNPFEWRFEFPEVLDDKGNFKGFDCVIGNPPYIRHENIKELKPKLQKNYEIFCGTSDIYTYFFERGLHLLKEGGLLSFITSNKWTRAGYGQALRQMILSKTIFRDYIDFNGEQIFESATVDTSITTLIRSKPQDNHSINYLVCDEISKLSSRNFQSIPIDSLSTDGFSFSSQSTLAIKAKIEELGTPLKEWDISINYGIKTGYNEAFIITTEKREEILSACADEEEKERTSKLIRKMLRGRDIKRYESQWAGLWLIFIPWHFPNVKTPKNFSENENDFQAKYPSLYFHLESYKEKLISRNKSETGIRYEWYCLQRWASNYYQDFEREKIVYREISAQMDASYDESQSIINNKLYLIVGENLKYLLGLLNSTLFEKMMLIKANNLGGKGADFLSSIKIPRPESNQALTDQIITLVNEILKQKEQNPETNTQNLESQIDSLVYELYNLTDKEIEILEGKNSNV